MDQLDIYPPPIAAHQGCSLCKAHHLTEEDQRRLNDHGVDLAVGEELLRLEVVHLDNLMLRGPQGCQEEALYGQGFTPPAKIEPLGFLKRVRNQLDEHIDEIELMQTDA